MPEVAPILDELVESGMLEEPEENYVVDVKIHMLMPNQYPCIPNWHKDFTPRDSEGKRIKAELTNRKMYMWLSGNPLTEYKNKETGATFTKSAQEWHSFTQNDVHRGTMSKEHTWRCFIRVIPKDFVHETTINVGQLRRHTQVYLDSKRFTW